MVTDPIGYLMLAWIIAGGLVFIFGPEIQKQQEAKRNAKIDRAIAMVKDYQEYEQPKWLRDAWANQPQTDKSCSKCGLSDEPIFVRSNSIDNKPYCKWCMELKQLRVHLQSHGQRRFQKAA